MKRVIVSGHFNPLHGGHLDLIEDIAGMGEYLIVIVNNDVQQMLKKGKIILSEENRSRLMAALRAVDEVVVALDKEDGSVTKTLEMIARKYPDDELIFGNGGDRSSGKKLPPNEYAICEKYNITMLFGVGGEHKADSSTRINQALGHL